LRRQGVGVTAQREKLTLEVVDNAPQLRHTVFALGERHRVTRGAVDLSKGLPPSFFRHQDGKQRVIAITRCPIGCPTVKRFTGALTPPGLRLAQTKLSRNSN
jgi:hypothetical protein